MYPSLSLYNSLVSLFIPFLFTFISFYLFVNLNLRLCLSNPFSLSQSILLISTCICFYLLPIHLYLFIYLCQSRRAPISFNPIYFILDYPSPIHLYLFISLVYPPLSLSISCLSGFTHISFGSL